MSTTARGAVNDEDGNPLAEVTAALDEVSNLFDRRLGTQITGAAGTYELHYAADFHDSAAAPRTLRLRIRLGQHVLSEQQLADVAGDTLTLPVVILPKLEVTSMLATLRTGQVSRFTRGNAIVWHADNVEAWGRAAAMVRTAQRTIDMMQLAIDVNAFETNVAVERPEVVLDFAPPLDATAPGGKRAVTTDDAKDGRLERLLLDAAQRNLKIRIQLPVPVIDLNALTTLTIGLLGEALAAALGVGAIELGASLASVWGGALLVGLGVLGILLLGIATLGFFVLLNVGVDRREGPFGMFPWDKIADWFTKAGASNVLVRPLHTQIFSVTHTKLLIVEGQQALLLGSPFHQGYFDAQSHLVDQPMRGNVSEGAPIHDMSISVRGPAVADLQEVFNSHWKLAEHPDPIDPPVVAPPLTAANPPELLASVQVVQSLNKAMFKDKPAGELGCLEAYLRAFHFAKRFIYCENQYFTPDVIRDALVDAVKASSTLQVILVLNVKPDTPFYWTWQKNNILAIAKALGSAADDRLGVFTLWSHDQSRPPEFPRPRLAKTYIHAKAAIIDNVWATVGSANLEGAALDYFELGHSLQGGDFRNTETNCVVFDPDEPQTAVVDVLRKKIWGEHLGLGENASELVDDGVRTDWLTLWNQRAELKRVELKNHPDVPSVPHVLRWPRDVDDNTSKAHLKKLDIPRDAFDLLDDGPRSFDFKRGDWKK